jgi:hypothetical protein
MITRNLCLAALIASIAIVVANRAPAAPLPITTNLIVNLNGDSTSNFVASGSNAVQLWKDLAEDGTDASRQDFGHATPGNQPALLPGTAVPNSVFTGLNYNVLDFDRSMALTNGSSSGPNSDQLLGKSPTTARPTAYGDPFTAGGDSAYQAANMADGMSWFLVIRSTDNTTINNSNGLQGGGSNRWGMQSMLDQHYTPEVDGIGSNWWGTFATDGPDADTQVNILNHVRNAAGVEVDQPNDSAANGTTGNMTPSTWYMYANSFDPVNGVFNTVVTTPDGLGGVTTLVNLSQTDVSLVNALGVGHGRAHLNATLGQLTSTNAARRWAFDGLMAEVLIYSTVLNTSDFNSVAGYLNDKYFIAPEPTSIAIAGFAIVLGGCMVRRPRKFN